jgi:hypothetical protein
MRVAHHLFVFMKSVRREHAQTLLPVRDALRELICS